MTTYYAEGSLVRLTGTFQDSAGVNVDPTTVSIVVKDPTPTTTTYVYGVDPEVIRSAAGVYYIDLDTTDHPGKWWYRWYSTGTGQAATTGGWFKVAAANPE